MRKASTKLKGVMCVGQPEPEAPTNWESDVPPPLNKEWFDPRGLLRHHSAHVSAAVPLGGAWAPQSTNGSGLGLLIDAADQHQIKQAQIARKARLQDAGGLPTYKTRSSWSQRQSRAKSSRRLNQPVMASQGQRRMEWPVGMAHSSDQLP
jgi:hypothetical protein